MINSLFDSWNDDATKPDPPLGTWTLKRKQDKKRLRELLDEGKK